MPVNVSYKGALTSYVITPKMQVRNLKDEISEKQNLYQFKLMYGDSELLDNKFLSKYLITKFAVCYDDKEAVMEINDVSLDVVGDRPEDKRVVTEKVTPEMTVGQFKEMISRKLCPTEGKRTLKKDGKELPDGSLLKTYIEVKTFTVEMQDMHVVIKQNTDKVRSTFSITTRSDATILEFKRLVSTKTGLQVEKVGLTFGGAYLDDYDTPTFTGNKAEAQRLYEGRTLGSYEIQEKSTVIIDVKVPGGLDRSHLVKVWMDFVHFVLL